MEIANEWNFAQDYCATLIPNVEEIYAQIHGCIDHLQSRLASRLLLFPHQIKIENERVSMRLQHLEQDASPASSPVGFQIRSTRENVASQDQQIALSSPVGCEIATENDGFFSTAGRKSILAADSPCSEADSRPGSRPCSSVSDRASKPSHSDSFTPAFPDDKIATRNSKTQETLCEMKTPKRQKSSILLQKTSQIADEACIVFAIHYASTICDMHDSTLSATVLNAEQFPSFLDVNSGASFLQSIPRLCQAIEYTSLGEQHCRIWKRIAMAHFFHSYEYAQKNSESFLGWYRNLQSNMLPPRGSVRSMVAQCFANLMLRPTNTTAIDSQKSRLNKIKTWRKCGKPWAKLITCFGYGILLLVPMSLADEDLRVAREEEICMLIDSLNGRGNDFFRLLQALNQSFQIFFTSRDHRITRETPQADRNSQNLSLV